MIYPGPHSVEKAQKDPGKDYQIWTYEDEIYIYAYILKERRLKRRQLPNNYICNP